MADPSEGEAPAGEAEAPGPTTASVRRPTSAASRRTSQGSVAPWPEGSPSKGPADDGAGDASGEPTKATSRRRRRSKAGKKDDGTRRRRRKSGARRRRGSRASKNSVSGSEVEGDDDEEEGGDLDELSAAVTDAIAQHGVVVPPLPRPATPPSEDEADKVDDGGASEAKRGDGDVDGDDDGDGDGGSEGKDGDGGAGEGNEADEDGPPPPPPAPEFSLEQLIDVEDLQAADLHPHLDLGVVRFSYPHAIALAEDGTAYVADYGNNRVMAWDIHADGPDQMVKRVAGGGILADAKKGGHEDGNGVTEALFNHPSGIAIHPSNGDVIIADTENHRIRRLSLVSGSVSTIAGCGEVGFLDGPASQATMFCPCGVAVGDDGSVYIADTGNHAIRRLSPDGYNLTTVCGGGQMEPGYHDGELDEARFNSPNDLIVAADGSLVVVDRNNHVVRRVSLERKKVATVAGTGRPGFKDGVALSDAMFNQPSGVCAMPDGSLIIVDRLNSRVRRLAADGRTVETLAGTGERGHRDGPAREARFQLPGGCVAVGKSGVCLVMDRHNQCVRRITPSVDDEGQQVVDVDTVCGRIQMPGCADGLTTVAGARMSLPLHFAAKGDGADGATIDDVLEDDDFDVNMQSALGRTALHVAASIGRVDSIEKLVERGIDTFIKDKFGHPALVYFLASETPPDENTLQLLRGFTWCECGKYIQSSKLAAHRGAAYGDCDFWRGGVLAKGDALNRAAIMDEVARLITESQASYEAVDDKKGLRRLRRFYWKLETTVGPVIMTCGHCQKRDAVSICERCDKYYCGRCGFAHDRKEDALQSFDALSAAYEWRRMSVRGPKKDTVKPRYRNTMYALRSHADKHHLPRHMRTKPTRKQRGNWAALLPPAVRAEFMRDIPDPYGNLAKAKAEKEAAEAAARAEAAAAVEAAAAAAAGGGASGASEAKGDDAEDAVIEAGLTPVPEEDEAAVEAASASAAAGAAGDAAPRPGSAKSLKRPDSAASIRSTGSRGKSPNSRGKSPSSRGSFRGKKGKAKRSSKGKVKGDGGDGKPAKKKWVKPRSQGTGDDEGDLPYYLPTASILSLVLCVARFWGKRKLLQHMPEVAMECVRPGANAANMSELQWESELSFFLHRRLPRLFFHVTGAVGTSQGRFWLAKLEDTQRHTLELLMDDSVAPLSPRFEDEEKGEVAAKLQSYFRRKKATRFVEAIREAREKAALLLQARYKGRVQRVIFNAAMAKRHWAAALMQAAVRGNNARAEVAILREEKARAEEEARLEAEKEAREAKERQRQALIAAKAKKKPARSKKKKKTAAAADATEGGGDDAGKAKAKKAKATAKANAEEGAEPGGSVPGGGDAGGDGGAETADAPGPETESRPASAQVDGDSQGGDMAAPAEVHTANAAGDGDGDGDGAGGGGGDASRPSTAGSRPGSAKGLSKKASSKKVKGKKGKGRSKSPDKAARGKEGAVEAAAGDSGDGGEGGDGAGSGSRPGSAKKAKSMKKLKSKGKVKKAVERPSNAGNGDGGGEAGSRPTSADKAGKVRKAKSKKNVEEGAGTGGAEGAATVVEAEAKAKASEPQGEEAAAAAATAES